MGKVREFEKKGKIRDKTGNSNRLSEHKSSIIAEVQSDDLSFYQNAMSRSQGIFTEVRKSQGR